jgi:hypothetical protein
MVEQAQVSDFEPLGKDFLPQRTQSAQSFFESFFTFLPRTTQPATRNEPHYQFLE